MGNLCCAESSASLSDRERRELEIIREKPESVKEIVHAKPESIVNISTNRIEDHIYPSPEFIRSQGSSIKEKPHLNDLKGKMFMNDPNLPSKPNEQHIYDRIYPPPTPVSVYS